MLLNHDQFIAIEQSDENKLICALPGSGKTHTIVSLAERILMREHTQVQMVTFTNAAAKEMEHRIHKRVEYEARSRVRSSTFAKIILQQFRTISCGRQMLLGGEQHNYVRRTALKTGIDLEQISEYEEVLDHISRTREHAQYEERYIQFYNEYIALMKRYKKIDLNHITSEVIDAIKENKIPALQITHLIVDEFQDTDQLQYEWMLAQQQQGFHVCAVGDDDQSIYSWRGACGYGNMIRFQKDFNSEGYLLSECFRCPSHILGVAKGLIEHNQDRIPKLMSSVKNETGKVSIIEIDKNYISPWTIEQKKRDGVLSTINTPKQNDKVNYEPYRYVADDILSEYFKWAILARTNRTLDNMELVFAERGIPCVRIGGKSILSDVHAIGMINLLFGGINPKLLSHLADGLGWLGEKEEVISQIHRTSKGVGFAAMVAQNHTDWICYTAIFHTMISTWECNNSNQDVVTKYINEYFDFIIKMANEKKHPDYGKQISIATLLKKIILNNTGDLHSRASKLLRLVTTRPKYNSKIEANDKVVLCTMNGAKGLQWPRVWVIQVEKGVIPNKKVSFLVDETHKKEEERRLLYVAMTRAEDELIVSYVEGKASEFINEL